MKIEAEEEIIKYLSSCKCIAVEMVGVSDRCGMHNKPHQRVVEVIDIIAKHRRIDAARSVHQ